MGDDDDDGGDGSVNPILTVTLDGTGGGVVTSDPAGIDCGTDCSQGYPENTQVTLIATPGSDAVFEGWSGACTGTGDCVVTMTGATSVTATFSAAQFVLAVTPSGEATGTVTSDDGSIDCGTTCSAAYDQGTQVTLTASPGAGATFDGWSGDCAGADACVVTMDADKTVGAAFNAPACLNNPQWMPVTCTTTSWVWSRDRTQAMTLQDANSLRLLATGCTHGSPQPDLGNGVCSVDGTGYVSTATFTMAGCDTSWYHLGGSFTGNCGGHDGDTYRHLVLGDDDCYPY